MLHAANVTVGVGRLENPEQELSPQAAKWVLSLRIFSSATLRQAGIKAMPPGYTVEPANAQQEMDMTSAQAHIASVLEK